MYLVKSGCHYAKAIEGKPVFRSTQDLCDAARFDTEEAAREWAPKVFRAGMLSVVEIVAEPARKMTFGRDATPLERAIARGENWVNREDADEVLFGVS